MLEGNSKVIVDIEELNQFKNSINLKAEEIVESFNCLYNLYKEIEDDGWNDESKYEVEDILYNIKSNYIDIVSASSQKLSKVLEIKIKLINDYLNFTIEKENLSSDYNSNNYCGFKNSYEYINPYNNVNSIEGIQQHQWTQFIRKEHRDEIFNILESGTEEDKMFLQKYGDLINGAFYNNGGGFFDPNQNKIFLNLAVPKDMDYLAGRKCRTSTMFHESGHLFDKVLSKKFFNSEQPLTSNVHFGQEIFNSISTDIANILNIALEHDGIDKIKDFNTPLNNMQINSIVKFLHEGLPDRKSKAEFGFLTDIIDGTTNGQLELLNRGFWAHESRYWSNFNNRSFIEVTNSEMWAEYFSARINKGKYWNDMQKLMPYTVNKLNDIFTKLLEVN